MAEAAPAPAEEPEQDGAEKRMPFLAHLDELRSCLRNSAIALFAGTIIAYPFRAYFFALLVRPLMRAWAETPALGRGELVMLSPHEGFMVLFHVKDADNFLRFTVGGWGNTQTACTQTIDGQRAQIGPSRPMSVEKDKWYDVRVEVKTGSSSVLSNCADDDKKFYDVQNVADLNAAFKDIGETIQALRLAE